MDTLHIDIETFSMVDLKKSNVYRYTEHPSFMILMAGWSLNGSETVVEDDPRAIKCIPGLWDPEVIKVAHNAPFERVCFSRFRGLPTGTYLPPEHWHDTMTIARELAWPASLEQLAKALKVAPKDSAGAALIRFFCMPNRKGQRNLPEDHPEKWEQFKAYCAQDVDTLREVDAELGGWPVVQEHRLYLADQRVNDRGIPVDLELARRAVAVAEDNRMVQELAITNLTGVSNPSAPEQMRTWLVESGLECPNMQAETIEELLLTAELTPVQRTVLELRQELALVAAKKFIAATNMTSADGRLRGQLSFHGAHTGRWSGRGLQVHNLPRESFTKEDPVTGKKVHDEAREAAAILDVKMGNGASAHALKALVRAMILGPDTVVDYASIEARVIAWLAGEEWALEAFRRGRDIYVETAERMSTKDRPLTRAQGKVAVLALGYQGGIRSLRVMGAEGTDDELQRLVVQWRAANQNIVDFWRLLNDTFITGGEVGDHIVVERDGVDRRLRLPSGRAITYHGVHTAWVDTQYGRRRRTYFKDYTRNGMRNDTYGGKLTENVTQAVARDIMAEAIVRLHDHGYEPVLHVHDEIVVEGAHPVDDIVKIMCEPPSWAAGLPVDGEGFVCNRYRKG